MSVESKLELIELLARKLSGKVVDITYGPNGRVISRKVSTDPSGTDRRFTLFVNFADGGWRERTQYPASVDTDKPGIVVELTDEETLNSLVNIVAEWQ